MEEKEKHIEERELLLKEIEMIEKLLKIHESFSIDTDKRMILNRFLEKLVSKYNNSLSLDYGI